MKHLKEAAQIGGAFVGVIVGAGFASGQEIMQFFTSFGTSGQVGALISSALFVFLAMALSSLGKHCGGDSHKEVITLMGGRYLGVAIDLMITFFMFAIVVVMFSGAGALLEQLLGLPRLWGSVLTMVATVLIVCLDVRQVIAIIGVLTAPLLLAVAVVAGWSIVNGNTDQLILDQAAAAQPRGADSWFVASLLYVSYNIVAGAPFLAILGSRSSDQQAAHWGGVLGGLLLGLLMLVIAGGMFAQVDHLGGVDLPMLKLASMVSPWVGGLMGLVIFGMILNTAVGMLYSFSVRLFSGSAQRFRVGVVLSGIAAFLLSFVGFIALVGTVYPFFGYLGFVLMACTLVAWWRLKRTGR
ncbi:MAG: hypothetical protein Q4B17_12160 [Lautropia sp.]|nr:hypothetical protein [Lautropia sp.]